MVPSESGAPKYVTSSKGSQPPLLNSMSRWVGDGGIPKVVKFPILVVAGHSFWVTGLYMLGLEKVFIFTRYLNALWVYQWHQGFEIFENAKA